MQADRDYDEEWPPGTVKLEDLVRNGEIILQPRPSVDPNDPLNWAPWRKYRNFGLACMYVVFVFADINVVTPTWGPMNIQMGFSYELLNDSYAAGCAALAIGGPLLIPFALKYGRRPIYVISTLAQFAIAIWTAKLQTVGDLVAVNTLNCLFGALSEIIVQMTVADVFFVHQRGRMNSYYCWFLNIGGSLAPLAAGYITVNQGWRWVWWWMTIFFGISFLVYIFMFEETKYSKTQDGIDPDQLQNTLSTNDENSKAMASDLKTAEATLAPNPEDIAPVVVDHTIPMRSYRQRLALWSTSPGSFRKLLFHSYQPLVIFATIPAVFYIGLIICGPLTDWSILFLAKRNKGIYKPEMRLWVIVTFIPFVPAGLFMFGFGLANGAAWPVLAVGYGLLSFGCSPASAIALTYLTDAYIDIVADSMVSITVTRNIVATAFVFAIGPWIDGIGMKNVFTMLGVLMTVILLSVFIFIFYGRNFASVVRRGIDIMLGDSLSSEY